MFMRIGFPLSFAVLIVALLFCAFRCLGSDKKIAKSVVLFDIALIPPIIGNLIIIVSTIKTISLIGCYIYYLGMDLVMFALVGFTTVYCKGIGNGKRRPTIMYIMLTADMIQILLNIVFGHAFDLEEIYIQGMPYYKMIPHFGQLIHRVVDYFVFACVILIFIVACIKSARIYRERYSIVLLTLLFIGAWQTFYIVSGTPVDRSMVGYGVFGILVYYLSMHYRPLRLLDSMLSNIASGMTEALFVYDQFGKCIWANDTGLKLLGLKNREIERVSESLKKKFGERKYTQQDWTDKYIIGTGDEALYYIIENHYVSEDSKHLAGSYLVIRDTTEEEREIKKELYSLDHDALTDLYTKKRLYERIKEVISRDSDTSYYTVYVDVKNFKIVNDIFGSIFGDMALQQLADWIRKNVDDNCVYGRLVGDTFGVLMPCEKFEADRSRIEKDLMDFTVSDGNVEHRLLVHLGVYEVVEKDIDVSVMFDRAHLALSTINDNYKQHIAYYDNKMRDKVLWDQKITISLSEALRTMQIRPYLQPITNREGKVVGAEALARWIHPVQGFLSPGLFITTLEKNGLIVEVDRHIWRCACQILSKWKEEHKDMFISVNISPKDFYYIDILSEITGLVKEYDIDPKKLRVEITETVMMTDADEKFGKLEELRKAGFIVEMDDFGSGYSSLNLLKDMPVDVLKIDMKFLANSDNIEKAHTIIKNIIKLSEELNIVSLTEGVETVQQYTELSDMGCKLFQGYYFAKPLPQNDFETFAFGEKRISV